MTEGREPEPRWRQVLNWGAVIAFFLFPVGFFVLQLVAIEWPRLKFEDHVKEFGWTRDYFRIICIVVLGLAGLNTWAHRNGKNGK